MRITDLLLILILVLAGLMLTLGNAPWASAEAQFEVLGVQGDPDYATLL